MGNYTLKTDADIFVERRLQESYTKVNNNKDYREICKKYFKLFEKIQEELSNKQDLWEQYETKEAEIYEMQLKEAYKTGFKDCMEIFRPKKNDSV